MVTRSNATVLSVGLYLTGRQQSVASLRTLRARMRYKMSS